MDFMRIKRVGSTICGRSHFKSSLEQMIIQARMQKASYIMASLSQRTTSLLKLPSQANVLSTRHLFLYSSAHLLRRPLRFLRGGMQGITPLRRSQLRKRSQSYALSATGRSGRFLHGTRTRSKVSWARFTSGRPGRWRASEKSRSHPPPASASSPCPPRSIRSLLFLPEESRRRGTPATTKASLPHPGSRGTSRRMRVHAPPPATSSTLAMPSHATCASAASLSTHNRCAVYMQDPVQYLPVIVNPQPPFAGSPAFHGGSGGRSSRLTKQPSNARARSGGPGHGRGPTRSSCSR